MISIASTSWIFALKLHSNVRCWETLAMLFKLSCCLLYFLYRYLDDLLQTTIPLTQFLRRECFIFCSSKSERSRRVLIVKLTHSKDKSPNIVTLVYQLTEHIGKDYEQHKLAISTLFGWFHSFLASAVPGSKMEESIRSVFNCNWNRFRKGVRVRRVPFSPFIYLSGSASLSFVMEIWLIN